MSLPRTRITLLQRAARPTLGRAAALILSLALGLALVACQEPVSGALIVPTVESAREPAAAEVQAAPETPAQPGAAQPVAPPAVPAAAQAPSTGSAASAAVVRAAGDGTTFSADRAYADLEQLAVQIGSRVAGSPAQRRAAEYLEAQFRAAGLQVERQPFTFSAFDDRGASLEVLGTDAPSPQALTLVYSPPGEVEGELIYVDLARTGDFDPAAVGGKVALARRGEIRFGEKVANLAAAGASGVIVFNNEPRNFSGNLGSRGQVPSVSLSNEDGERLLALLERGPVRVRLKVDATMRDHTGDNVIATRSGGPRTVVIGGHYDSVAAGPGANDNGSGSATLLELARVVASRQYPFSVRFVAFEAEEIGLLGSAHYVRELSQESREATLAMINLDMVGVGDRLSFGGDAELVELAIRKAGELGIVAHQLRGGAGSASDHASFQAVGIPSLFVYRSEDPRYHTADDRAEYVQRENLAIAGSIVLDMLDELAANRAPPARE